MINQEIISQRITTIISFAAVILGLLVNSLSKLTIDNSTTNNYSSPVIFTILMAVVTTYYLVMSMIIGLSILNVNIPTTTGMTDEPEKILQLSRDYFGKGLLAAAMVIVLVFWKSTFSTWSEWSILLVFVFIGSIYLSIRKQAKKMKTNKSNTNMENINIHCNYLTVDKSNPAERDSDIFRCLINPQIEYNPEMQEVLNNYGKTDNFLNCPRIKLSTRQ